jgi:outer membrane protein OmpA-like peptidoglycan-associated protein
MCSLLFAALLAAATLPPYAVLPEFVSDGNDRVENAGVDEFPIPDQIAKRVEGKHYVARMHSEPPWQLDPEPTWERLKRSYVARGWKVLIDAESKVLRLQSGDHDAWLKLDVVDSDDVRVSLIEVVHEPIKLTLVPPAAQPEKITTSGDFPYLRRVPGSTLKRSESESQPLDVTVDGDGEPHLAGSSTIAKFYTVPEQISVHQFITAYRDALTAVGWNIVMTAEPADGALIAHYEKNGRDIWTSMRINADDIVVRVADAGTAADLRAQLDKLCRVPLYGIHFDSEQATLRNDSESALQQILTLLQSDPARAIEVTEPSQPRAEAVKSWLVARGVAATRVTASAYSGRAPNRRVEVGRVGCR